MEPIILSGSLNEERKTGSRTRLMRFPPGTRGAEPIVPNTYTCCPPGAWHGPFRSETGCLLLEIHYFDPEDAAS